MTGKHLLAPLSLVLIALGVALAILWSPAVTPITAQQSDPTDIPADTPEPTQNTQQNGYPGPQTTPDTTPQSGYPGPGSPAVTETVTAAPRTPPAVPTTASGNPTSAPPTAPLTQTSVLTLSPTAAGQPSQPTSAATVAPAAAGTPESAPTLAAGDLVCPAGEVLQIAAEGPPYAGYLILFGGRAVGGGTVRPDGTIQAEVVVGNERPGRYVISIVQRGTSQELRRLSCTVPPRPSPTPVRR